MPKPRTGEKRNDFVDRCIPVVLDDGTASSNKQAVAICHGIFDQHLNRNETMDFVMNGQGHGDVATTLLRNNFDVGALRPYIAKNGQHCITVNNGKDHEGKPKYKVIPNGAIHNGMVVNANATLRKDEWILLDEAVVRVAQERLIAAADLRSAGLTFGGFNGMMKTVIEHQEQSDVSAASVSMDGLTQSAGDRPHYDLTGIPLPITHKDFKFSAREVMVSRNGNTPLDTTMAELAARKVAEEIEKMVIGSTTFGYGGYNVQGYTSFASRSTKTDVTAPTAGGWTPADTVEDILDMIQTAQDAFHYGPYMVYHSTAWSKYMDDDYSAAKGDLTLRERIRRIDQVQDVKRLDFLTGTVLLLVQMTSNVVQLVNGMDITTVQWESNGGMQLNFKVMAIQVPRLRADFAGNTGIVHGTTS